MLMQYGYYTVQITHRRQFCGTVQNAHVNLFMSVRLVTGLCRSLYSRVRSRVAIQELSYRKQIARQLRTAAHNTSRAFIGLNITPLP